MAHNEDYSTIWNENGLTMDEIGRALGNASRTINVLAVAPSINKWAKFKPQRSTVTRKLTDAERALGNYGIVNIPEYNRVGTMITDMRAGNYSHADFIRHRDTNVLDMWDYARPRLADGDRARMLDFAGENTGEGYRRGAFAPLGTADASQYEKRPFSGFIAIGWNGYFAYGDTGNLFLQDFNIEGVDLGRCYLCLCLYNGSTAYVMTDPDEDAALAVRLDDLGSASFVSRNMPVGNWHAFLFVSNYAIPFGTGYGTAGHYFPLEFTRCDITITQGTVHITIPLFDCWFSTSAKSTIDGGFTIKNEDTEGWAISDVKVDYIAAGGSVLHSSTVMAGRTIAANSSVSGTFNEPANIVSRYDLYLAVGARIHFTVQTLTVQEYTDITVGPSPVKTI